MAGQANQAWRASTLHICPVCRRLIIPGYIGGRMIKWLEEITVTEVRMYERTIAFELRGLVLDCLAWNGSRACNVVSEPAPNPADPRPAHRLRARTTTTSTTTACCPPTWTRRWPTRRVSRETGMVC